MSGWTPLPTESTEHGPNGAKLQHYWEFHQTGPGKKNDWSLQDKIKEYGIAERADTLFHDICDRFDRRHAMVETLTAMRDPKYYQQFPDSVMRHQQEAGARIKVLDAEDTRFIANTMDELRPLLGEETKDVVGRIIRDSVLSYYMATDRHVEIAVSLNPALPSKDHTR